jgi:hypothetical protein
LVSFETDLDQTSKRLCRFSIIFAKSRWGVFSPEKIPQEFLTVPWCLSPPDLLLEYLSPIDTH